MFVSREIAFENVFGEHCRRTQTLIKSCHDMQKSIARLQVLLKRMSKRDLDKLAARIRKEDARKQKRKEHAS